MPERGDFGEENCPGKGGADRGKKGKKDAQKKVGFTLAIVIHDSWRISSEFSTGKRGVSETLP